MACFEVMGGQKFRPRHVLIWAVLMSELIEMAVLGCWDVGSSDLAMC